jgi:short-subunit dehydrogenase
MNATTTRPLAIVTGASSGLGLELARCAARDGHDLVIAADDPAIEEAAKGLRGFGATVDAYLLDLATPAGCAKLVEAIGQRPVALLLANAGHGLGHAFLDQDFDAVRHVIDTNVTGTLALAHAIGKGMRERRSGRILFTGSIAGLMPGAFQAVYNGTKAFVDSFALALRNELKDSGVTVTCLLPGATETHFFQRAQMEDTKVGVSQKDDPADVAKDGYDALMKGEDKVVSGWKNKVEAAMSRVVPDSMLAEQHRKTAAPGSASS